MEVIVGPVCASLVSVCLSVCQQDYWKAIVRFRWNLMLWVGLPDRKTDYFWWWSGAGYGFRIIFQFPRHCRIGHYKIY